MPKGTEHGYVFVSSCFSWFSYSANVLVLFLQIADVELFELQLAVDFSSVACCSSSI
jgi:hypothetical protein